MKMRAIGVASLASGVRRRGIVRFSGGQIFVAHARQSPRREIRRRFGGKFRVCSVWCSCEPRRVWRFFCQPPAPSVHDPNDFFCLTLETKHHWLVGANEKRMKIHPFSKDAVCDKSESPILSRQAFATLGTAGINDRATATRFHASTKAVGAFTTNYRGLKGTFHGVKSLPKQ